MIGSALSPIAAVYTSDVDRAVRAASVRYGQNTSNGTQTVIKRGSRFIVWDMP